MSPLPEPFTRTIEEVHGAAGVEWLRRLPGLIAENEQRWGLKALLPFSNLSYNYVAPAVYADGTQAVLKLGVPNPELTTEIEALRLCHGQGMALLLAADAESGVLVQERLRPGTPLTHLTDDVQATSIAVQVMRQLWRPAPAQHAFPTIARWSAGLGRLRRRFDGGTGPLPPHLVEKAERLFAELFNSMAEPVLLHGDLHHDNILAAERQPWLALDPKGLVGEPAYEVGTLLYNIAPQFLAEQRPERILARRVWQLAEELGFDRERVRSWGVAQAVLSACWTVEDNGRDWDWAINCAEWLAAMK
jgi:streptomycin 6-kinase